jgi:hypothetical protein
MLLGHGRTELQRRTTAMTSPQWRLAVVAEPVFGAHEVNCAAGCQLSCRYVRPTSA